ncbi:hypothetical protein ACROYT_G017767 [Oculina patagonica]
MDDQIKVFNFRELKIQRVLGRGTFGIVYLARSDEQGVTNQVVMKVMHESLAIGDGTRKLFMKEAKLLTGLQHENIVRMYGICVKPFGIILEYVVFDFSPFSKDTKVNTLDKFLSEIAQMSKSEGRRFDHLIPAIAMDVTNGLSHLHQQEIAHRDLKPMNILISNQHYCDLQDMQQLKRIKAVRPVVCKLADFGESRSQLLQTNGLNDPDTNQVFRGTIAFMAPEILLPERTMQGKKLSLDDLKKVDIWALGLVFYCLINPGSFPYDRDGYEHLIDIINMQRQRKRPSSDPEYQSKQANVWAHVRDVFHACTNHDPSGRPRASQVINALVAPREPGNPGVLMTNETPLRHASPGTNQASSQWYAGEQGEADLKYAFDKLTEIADGQVKMSRKTENQNISMCFQRHGQQWQVKFPPDFPRSNASVSTNGRVCAEVGGKTIRSAVRAIISAIKHPPAVGAHAIPAQIDADQWYGGEQGEETLRYVLNELKSTADNEVKMSRKKDTQDVTLSFERLGQHWQVKFPSNFPRSEASLSRNGHVCGMVGGNDVETAVRAIVNRVSTMDQPLAGIHDNPDQWYAGEYGEASLKHVFDELKKIADGNVDMSRKTDTKDITLCFYRQGQEWQVKFPPDFPSSNAALSINRNLCATIGGDDVEDAIRAIIRHITSMDQPPAASRRIKPLCSIS